MICIFLLWWFSFSQYVFIGIDSLVTCHDIYCDKMPDCTRMKCCTGLIVVEQEQILCSQNFSTQDIPVGAVEVVSLLFSGILLASLRILNFFKRGSYTRHLIRLTIVSFLCERKTMFTLDNSINDLMFWSITIRIRFLIYQVPYYDN